MLNTIGMKLRRIEPGSFLMGNDRALPDNLLSASCFRFGDFDERPVNRVFINQPFYMSEYQITNALYEQFDPSHKKLRGKLGFSNDDDEAVVFVSWHEAAAFCEWLSSREGKQYRLPTEAEWEYACRAGTTTAFHTGDALPEDFHKNVGQTWFPDEARTKGENVVPLSVGQTPPNEWGLYDMHGNVEEWCLDWYSPYSEQDRSDPQGAEEGDFRVTRGGSHSTDLYYLRSANRMGTLPDEKSWLIGFRIVQSDLPAAGRQIRSTKLQINRNNILQVKSDTAGRHTLPPESDTPVFLGPIRYVNIPDNSYGPMFSRHNHDPAICECPNGDLLAIWYSCVREPGRELAVLASRLRAGADAWEPASPFWDAPDRNNHAPALWCDGKIVYHFNGLSAAATWGPLQTILRTSTDSGATWSKAKIIIRGHGPRHMPIASVFELRDGTIVLPCDAVSTGHGGTALWMSADKGESWRDTGGTIAGIHGSAVELAGGELFAFGRGDEIEGRLAMSISDDRGTSWRHSASIFPPIGGGQRLVLRRLKGECSAGKDPLLFISFANEPIDSDAAFTVLSRAGEELPVSGMFCALSFDDGKTWSHRRLISDEGPDRLIEALDGNSCVLGPQKSEVNGYLSACQARNGMVHLISSRNYYSFNLAWLSERK